MSDPSQRSATDPPPAPPLPPPRLGSLQRFIAPLGLGRVSGKQDTRPSLPERPTPPTVSRRSYGSLPSQTAAHRTGIPIAALDINHSKTHAILAGKEILRTVRVQDGRVTEEFNLRNSITSYESTHGSSPGQPSSSRADYLPARDVKWSIDRFDHVIATAAVNGRIALYDVNAAGSRIEIARLHEHAGQVNKLDFDPFSGYLLLSAGQDKTVRLWDIRDPKTTRSKQRFEVRGGVRDVKWSPKEGNDFDFAVCVDNGIIQNWDARNPLGPKLSINAHDRGCYSLDWHPDGRHVVSGGFDKYVRVWDFKSDSRRQKPSFHFRAPQAIRIVQWRPAMGVLGDAGSVRQTTQIATTYHFDDPRIHVWDFRRPFLPFRELDMYNTPAADYLWASQDLLWTVGDQGVFTQNDITFAPQVINTLPPSAMDWLPNGQCAMFSEGLTDRRESDSDPMQGFLNLPGDRLSGEDGDGITHQDVEPDEIVNESLLTTSFGRRQSSRYLSSRTTTSRTNSPPANAVPVQQLTTTILASIDVLQNGQTGAFGTIEGSSAEPDVVRFLADKYSSPASTHDRKRDPSVILERLEACLQQNADLCDEVSLHRMAQSWRILSAVIIPELREWADGNRSKRRATAAVRKAKDLNDHATEPSGAASPFAKISSTDFQTKADGKDAKVLSNLFRGLKEPGTWDAPNSSNMTTPLARPLPESPRTSVKTPRHRGTDNSSRGIEQLEALPPALLNSHSAASAAAQALINNESDSSQSPPEKSLSSASRPAWGDSAGHTEKGALDSSPVRHTDSPSRSVTQNTAARQQTLRQRQDEQRAALRDYKAQARPIFKLDTPTVAGETNDRPAHNSTESFPMFPASTSSSHKHSAIPPSSSSGQHASCLSRQDSEASTSSAGLGSDHDTSGGDQYSSPRPFYGSNDFDGGLGSSVPRDTSIAAQDQSSGESKTSAEPFPSTLSSSPEMFHFDPSGSPPRTRIHSINPVTKLSTSRSIEPNKPSELLVEDDLEVMASTKYLFSDFRPIDLSKYHPRLPFGWSALPLICQMIAFDLENGIAGAQFAAHLVLHIAPYFFAKDFDTAPVSTERQPTSVAERLMLPGSSHRILESLLLQHTNHLQRVHLFESFAEIRKACAELGFDRVAEFGLTEPKVPGAPKKDPYLVSSICPHCQLQLEAGKDACARCSHSRPPCPICLRTRAEAPSASVPASLQAPRLWSFCHACAHSAHSSCMTDWLIQPFSHGGCPTPNCDCDCGPGIIRSARIAHQLRSQDDASLIRGTAGPVKKDSVRASHSPAVDKTRASLRATEMERGTQSSDERSWPASAPIRKGSGRRSMGGLSGMGVGVGVGGNASARGKSVRVVMPGEETDQPTG